MIIENKCRFNKWKISLKNLIRKYKKKISYINTYKMKIIYYFKILKKHNLEIKF